jgi:cytochrome c-type biogenesis protein CcmH
VKRTLLVLLLSFSLMLLLGAKDDRYGDLGGKIMCSCGCNQMLLKCNHVGCPDSDRMISQLKSSVADTSLTDEDVLNVFRRNYGVTVVVSPATHGFELTAWVMPPLVLGITLVLVVLLVRRWRQRAASLQVTELAGSPQLNTYRDRARKDTEL